MADAERWYARLMAPDFTASEHLEFKRWQADAEHAAAYAQTELLWLSMGKLADHPEFEQLSRQVLADTERGAKTNRRRRFVVVTATATAIPSASKLTRPTQRLSPGEAHCIRVSTPTVREGALGSRENPLPHGSLTVGVLIVVCFRTALSAQ